MSLFLSVDFVKKYWIPISVAVAVVILVAVFIMIGTAPPSNEVIENSQKEEKIVGSFDESKFKSEDEWKSILTSEQFNILRQAGTETPFTGELLDEKRAGTYYSYGCDEPLFRSDTKYDSETGWPSFWAPINPDAVVLREESDSLLGKRIEVLDKCGGHLGHVFEDGPEPTGKRFCMNSVALYFVPDEE